MLQPTIGEANASKVPETSVAVPDSKEESTKPEVQPATSSPNKRKSWSNSTESTSTPTKRVRKKKSDPPPSTDGGATKTTITTTSLPSTQLTTGIPTSSCLLGPGPLLISTPAPAKRVRKKKSDPTPPTDGVGSKTTIATTSLPSTQLTTGISTSSCLLGPGPLLISTPVVGNRLLQGMNSLDVHDMNSRYFSPMISPYHSMDQLNTPSLSRSSLSRLFSTSLNDANHGLPDEITKAFNELRESTWNHLSKCVLEHAQQFDIPSLIGTLYSLRSENEKLVNKVRDLTAKRDQLLGMSARLDLPGPMLTQHLNNTSPNFSSVVSGLANSPKSLPMPSPGAPIPKSPLHPTWGFVDHGCTRSGAKATGPRVTYTQASAL